VAAVNLLKQSGVSGNLATEFSWGEYVLWHLGPAIKVSIDGRRETVYSQDVYQKNISFMFGTGNWDAVLKDYPTDMALVINSPNDIYSNFIGMVWCLKIITASSTQSGFIRRPAARARMNIHLLQKINIFHRDEPLISVERQMVTGPSLRSRPACKLPNWVGMPRAASNSKLVPSGLATPQSGIGKRRPPSLRVSRAR
jgi:hypothetical protein